VIEKAAIPVHLLDRENSTPLIEAWFEIVHLKQVYRKGWLERGIAPELCESVADHTFGNAMLCVLLLDQHPELDAGRVLKLALVHDIGEAYVGDITPNDNVAPEDKRQRESEAIQTIFEKLPNGGQLIAHWHEYEAQETAEAKFVKQIDRFEFAMQASVYEHQGIVDASAFLDHVEKQLTSPVLRDEMSTLRKIHKPQ
jgi:putative hydrolase of HD superfamily